MMNREGVADQALEEVREKGTKVENDNDTKLKVLICVVT